MDLIAAETNKLDILTKSYEAEKAKNEESKLIMKQTREAEQSQAEQEAFLLQKSEEIKVERAAEAKMKRLVYAMETADKQTGKIIPVLSTYQGLSLFYIFLKNIFF